MKKITYIIIIIFVLFLISYLMASLLETNKIIKQEKIIVIPIKGIISMEQQDLFGSKQAHPDRIIEEIQKAANDKSVQGIIFEINSPGGTVVASQEIAEAIEELNKTNYAVIREIGTSGGYWIASATDKIYASEMSITGSIGVLSSYLQFADLFEKYGITYERIVGGEHKDLGNPYKELNEEEKQILQKKVNQVHNYFIEEVAKNRKIEVTEIRKIATGEFYLGKEAKELNLIDAFGNKEEAIKEMKKELGKESIMVIEKEEKEGILSIFSKISAFYFGKGFASVLSNEKFLEQETTIQVR